MKNKQYDLFDEENISSNSGDSVVFGTGMGAVLGFVSEYFVNYGEILEPYFGRMDIGDVLFTGIVGGAIVGGGLGYVVNKISERIKGRKTQGLEDISIE